APDLARTGSGQRLLEEERPVVEDAAAAVLRVVVDDQRPAPEGGQAQTCELGEWLLRGERGEKGRAAVLDRRTRPVVENGIFEIRLVGASTHAAEKRNRYLARRVLLVVESCCEIGVRRVGDVDLNAQTADVCACFITLDQEVIRYVDRGAHLAGNTSFRCRYRLGKVVRGISDGGRRPVLALAAKHVQPGVLIG